MKKILNFVKKNIPFILFLFCVLPLLFFCINNLYHNSYIIVLKKQESSFSIFDQGYLKKAFSFDHFGEYDILQCPNSDIEYAILGDMDNDGDLDIVIVTKRNHIIIIENKMIIKK